MEAMLGISLYSYLYLKLVKMLFLKLYPMFSLQTKSEDNQVLPESRGGGVGGGGCTNNAYTCK
jgi:hypothetical protein